jgi:hypothetical protein
MSSFPLYLAHGAGVGHTNDFLSQLGAAISAQREQLIIPVTFSYMKEQALSMKRRPPPRFSALIPEYANYIEHEEACIVAGKSMGGRVATQLSHLPMVKAIVCFGFPFHPVGKPEKNRLAFLSKIEVPCLIVQGTRDALGRYEWVSQQTLPKNIEIMWIEGADHDFKTLKKYNTTINDTINHIAAITQDWLMKAI